MIVIIINIHKYFNLAKQQDLFKNILKPHLSDIGLFNILCILKS
jgi:hypothetical protein